MVRLMDFRQGGGLAHGEVEGCYYTLPPVQMPEDDMEEEDEDNAGKGDAPVQKELAQQLYDDQDYRTYRSRAPSYLDPAFMPS